MSLEDRINQVPVFSRRRLPLVATSLLAATGTGIALAGIYSTRPLDRQSRLLAADGTPLPAASPVAEPITLPDAAVPIETEIELTDTASAKLQEEAVRFRAFGLPKKVIVRDMDRLDDGSFARVYEGMVEFAKPLFREAPLQMRNIELVHSFTKVAIESIGDESPGEHMMAKGRFKKFYDKTIGTLLANPAGDYYPDLLSCLATFNAYVYAPSSTLTDEAYAIENIRMHDYCDYLASVVASLTLYPDGVIAQIKPASPIAEDVSSSSQTAPRAAASVDNLFMFPHYAKLSIEETYDFFMGLLSSSDVGTTEAKKLAIIYQSIPKFGSIREQLQTGSAFLGS